MATAADVLVRVRATGVTQFERDMDRVANKAKSVASTIGTAFGGAGAAGGVGAGGRGGKSARGNQRGTSGGAFGMFQNPLILVPKLMMAMAAYHMASSILTLPRRLAEVGLGAIDAAANLESLSNGLRIVMGDAAKATEEFEKLRQAAKLPGLGLMEGGRGSIDLQTMGMNAKMARDAMIEISNAVKLAGGGKEQFGEVMLGMTQLYRKGRNAYGQELNLQIGPQLPQMRPILQSAFGTSDSQELQRKGISGAQIFEALALGLRKLPRAVDDTRNALDNLEDALTFLYSAVGKTFAPMINDAIKAFTAWVEVVTKSGWINEALAPIKRMLDTFFGKGVDNWITIVATLGEIAKMIPVGIEKVFNWFIDQWFQAGAILWDVITVFKGAVEKLAPVIDGLTNMIAKVGGVKTFLEKINPYDPRNWVEKALAPIRALQGLANKIEGVSDTDTSDAKGVNPFRRKNRPSVLGLMSSLLQEINPAFGKNVQDMVAKMRKEIKPIDASTDPSQWKWRDPAGELIGNTADANRYLASIDDKMDVLERRVLGGAGIDALAPTAVELGRYRTNGGGINIKVQGGGTMEQLVADIARQVLLQARGAAVI